MNVIEHNGVAWDNVTGTSLEEWSKPVSSKIIENAKMGISEVLLTNARVVPTEWYMPMKGKKVLCLASGGGQQAPIFSAMGGIVTVVDISENQLNKDRLVAERENLDMEILKYDMCDLSIFADETFDMIFHPISNCFIPNPKLVWKESYRVLKKGGTLLAGFINPVLYLFDMDDFDNGVLTVKNKIPYSDIEQLPKEELEKRIANNDVLEYGHTLETLIGGQTELGFAITAFYEDFCQSEVLDKHICSSIATKAIKL